MSVIKKLMMTAAGGEEPLAIEDVFSTYLYTGNSNSQPVRNGISLSSFNNVNKIATNASPGTIKFKGNYFFGITGADRLSDPLGTITYGTGIPSAGEWFAADSNYIYTESNNDFYYSTDGISFTQMTYNPQNSGAVDVSNGMVVLSDGTLVVTHQNVINGYESVSVTSNQGATSWNGPYTISTTGGWQAPIKLVNGVIYGIYSGGQIKYSTTGTSWSNGATVSGATTITYLNSGVYILGTDTGYIHTSTTGTGSWTQRSRITTDNLGIRGLVSDGTTAYALSIKGVWSSTDGISWTKIKNIGMPYSGYPYPQVDFDSTNKVIFFGDEPGTISLNVEDNGGLVWLKTRSSATSHALFDTERGVSNKLSSDTTGVASTSFTGVSSFNSDGFSLGSVYNTSPVTYASWTFRKAPRFFDVVTFTTTYNVNPNVISYNLEADLGCAIFKQLNSTGQGINWIVYHRSLGTGKYLRLNETASTITDAQSFVAVDNANSTISFGYPMSNINDRLVSGGTETTNWVGYFFAHDPLGPSGDGSDGLIACGSFTTDYSGNATIDLGWEPQFILWKRADGSSSWTMFDSMRGLSVAQNLILVADQSNAEQSLQYLVPDATGFSSNPGFFGAGQTYIYIAIRRGPMRQPESGTEVFAIGTKNGTSSLPSWKSGFPTDFFIYRDVNAVNNYIFGSRLTEPKTLTPPTTSSEGTTNAFTFDHVNGVGDYITADATEYGWMFRRAPGFFDVVAYTGTSGTATKPHNLGVVPEMMIFKNRTDTDPWIVYHSATGNTGYIPLHLASGFLTSSLAFNNTSPTASVFTVGNTLNFNSPQKYIAYLFATLAGVSKVGSYTGNGSSQTINCGFTGGARFVLIKRTNGTGDWYVWDTARGIVSGNDPHLSLNTTAAEVTTDDSIDPTSSGFVVNQVAATNVNVSSASYIYLAIA